MSTAPSHITDGVRVTGTLQDDALLSYTPEREPQAVLTFELPADKGLPYRVRQLIGRDPNAHIAAQAKAQMLRRGVQVSVHGKGLRVSSDHGIACLVIVDVENVFALTTPPGRSQRINHQE
jgi:hypothetical protein